MNNNPEYRQPVHSTILGTHAILASHLYYQYYYQYYLYYYTDLVTTGYIELSQYYLLWTVPGQGVY